MKFIKKTSIYFITLFTVLLTACGTTSNVKNQKSNQTEKSEPAEDTIELLFAGDIMAHSVNYYITSFDKIYRDVKDEISAADLAFANLEAPINTKKAVSNYPNFNTSKEYVQAAVDAGFDVFSLCNNHTNDQLLDGIKETQNTMNLINSELQESEDGEEKKQIWYSGLKDGEKSDFTYNIIETNGWKILFLPVTELLNRPDYSSYINYIKTDEKSRKAFIEYLTKLREENPCDLFILSLHTSEVEYVRTVTEKQETFYKQILDAGIDILWANHAHIIKDRKVIINENGSDKIIMYANGNTISGQRTKPDFTARNPNGERDNTGDGLFYKVFLKKESDGTIKLKKAEPYFITTYINTAYEYVIKPLNQTFVDYLYSVPRTDWAKYIEKRIKINKDETKDLIEWQ